MPHFPAHGRHLRVHAMHVMSASQPPSEHPLAFGPFSSGQDAPPPLTASSRGTGRPFRHVATSSRGRGRSGAAPCRIQHMPPPVQHTSTLSPDTSNYAGLPVVMGEDGGFTLSNPNNTEQDQQLDAHDVSQQAHLAATPTPIPTPDSAGVSIDAATTITEEATAKKRDRPGNDAVDSFVNPFEELSRRFDWIPPWHAQQQTPDAAEVSNEAITTTTGEATAKKRERPGKNAKKRERPRENVVETFSFVNPLEELSKRRCGPRDSVPVPVDPRMEMARQTLATGLVDGPVDDSVEMAVQTIQCMPQSVAEVEFNIFDPPMTPVVQESRRILFNSLFELNDHDVLLVGGQGGGNAQLGNRRFHDLIRDFQPTYLLAKTKEKSLLARSVVLVIRKRGGRFVKKDDKTGGYYEIGDVKAQKKALLKLREGLNIQATQRKQAQSM